MSLHTKYSIVACQHSSTQWQIQKINNLNWINKLWSKMRVSSFDASAPKFYWTAKNALNDNSKICNSAYSTLYMRNSIKLCEMLNLFKLFENYFTINSAVNLVSCTKKWGSVLGKLTKGPFEFIKRVFYKYLLT